MAGTNAAAPYGSDGYGNAFKSQAEADTYAERSALREKNLKQIEAQHGAAPTDQNASYMPGQQNIDLDKDPRYSGMTDAELTGALGALANSPEGWKLHGALLKKYGNQVELNKKINEGDTTNRFGNPIGSGKYNHEYFQRLGTLSTYQQNPEQFGGQKPAWLDSFAQQIQQEKSGQVPPATDPYKFQGGQAGQGGQTGQAGQGPGQQPPPGQGGPGQMGGKKGQQPPGMQGGGNLMLGPAGMTTTGGPNQLGIGGGGQTGPGSYWQRGGAGGWNWSGRDQQQTPPGGWNASNGGVMIGQGQVYDPNNPNAGAIYGPPGSGFGGGAQKRWGGGAMGGRMIQDPNQQQQPAAQPASPWNPDTQTGYQSTEGYQQATGLPAATTNAPGQVTSPATPGASPATPGAAPQPGQPQQPWGQQPGKNQKAQKPPSMQAGGGMGKGRAPQAPQGY